MPWRRPRWPAVDGSSNLKIAFISQEYPPDTAAGGIASYVYHASRMLAARRHLVEVFTRSASREGREDEAGVTVHRVRATHHDFGERIAPIAFARHQEVGLFDVVESPELNADAAEFLRLAPETPLVVKLHTPSYLIGRFTAPPMTRYQKLRFALGAVRRGERPQWPDPTRDNSHHAFERDFARLADEVAAPSKAIADLLIRDWRINRERVACFPLPFAPSDALLRIPPDGGGARVLFVGRLEPRKGVQHLAAAIPLVRRTCPEARFRFVGQVLHSPKSGEPMDAYIRRRTGAAHAEALEFVAPVPPKDLAKHFEAASIAVFPSIWESFGYVCLEAMAAGRAVVGSASGGMREILADGDAGALVAAGRPSELAAAIIRLLCDPAERRRLGAAGRKRVRDTYDYDVVAPVQEASYARAIARRRAAGRRVQLKLAPRPAPAEGR